MKKLLLLVLVLTLAVSAFAACGKDKDPVEKDYNLSIGVATTDTLASSKVTQTVAAIVTDADGRIVLCRIDSVDYTAFKDGAIVTTAPTSKVALGEAYGSMPAGTWSVQGAAFEKFVVGKTQAEVAAIAVENGKATDADLKAGCTIAITDIQKAVDNAFKNEHKIAFKSTATAFTAGLSVLSSVKDTSADSVTNVKLSTEYAATVLAEGKVVAAILDTAEPEIKGITQDGATSVSYKGTKRAQGEAYGSMPSGTFYVQADVYAKVAIGKSASDIETLATDVAGCSIYTGNYKKGIVTAVKAAR